MSVFAHVDGLGAQIEQIVCDCVLDFREEFLIGQYPVDVIAEHITEVATSVMLRPAGIAMVTVAVKGRRPRDVSTHVFRLKRKKGGKWIIGASSL